MNITTAFQTELQDVVLQGEVELVWIDSDFSVGQHPGWVVNKIALVGHGQLSKKDFEIIANHLEGRTFGKTVNQVIDAMWEEV